jgi:hypothetical protein
MLTALILTAALHVVETASASTTPVGPLPPGPTSTTTSAPNQLVAVALPRASKASGLIWRLARRYDSSVVRQISEADVDANVVLVFKIVGRGTTSLVFALTRGDTSPSAVGATTHTVISC